MNTLIKIPIIDKSVERHFILTEDNELKCSHPNAEVTPPCCSSRGSSGFIECGCAGLFAVYCSDCKNEDMTESDIEELIG